MKTFLKSLLLSACFFNGANAALNFTPTDEAAISKFSQMHPDLQSEIRAAFTVLPLDNETKTYPHLENMYKLSDITQFGKYPELDSFVRQKINEAMMLIYKAGGAENPDNPVRIAIDRNNAARRQLFKIPNPVEIAPSINPVAKQDTQLLKIDSLNIKVSGNRVNTNHTNVDMNALETVNLDYTMDSNLSITQNIIKEIARSSSITTINLNNYHFKYLEEVVKKSSTLKNINFNVQCITVHLLSYIKANLANFIAWIAENPTSKLKNITFTMQGDYSNTRITGFEVQTLISELSRGNKLFNINITTKAPHGPLLLNTIELTRK